MAYTTHMPYQKNDSWCIYAIGVTSHSSISFIRKVIVVQIVGMQAGSPVQSNNTFL